MTKALKWVAGIFVGLIVLGAIAGCGGSDTDQSGSSKQQTASKPASTPTPTPTPTPPPDPEVRVVFDGPYQTTADTVTLHGHTTRHYAHGRKPKVHVKGASSVTQKGAKWTAVVTIRHRGDNSYKVSATMKGAPTDRTDAVISRKASPAELAAAKAAERTAFINSAQSIPYSQLIKDPEQYRGTKVVLHGQIFQIQQSGGFGIMLVSVTDEGYGIWDDNVWVDYGPSAPVHGAENDLVTVYGVVKGSKSYDTQAGGSTFVPRVRAKYIDG